jgi:tetratricopeptide (TPR) repeat protein
MRRRVGFHAKLMILFFSFLLITPVFSQSAASDNGSMKAWIQKLKQNPNDVQAWNELGRMCFQAKRLDMANKCFLRAEKLSPKNAQTLYYMGQLLEAQDKKANALRVYVKYASADAGPFRERMEERYQVLRREVMKEELLQLLEDEKAIGASKVSPQAVAVLPFSVQETDPQLGPVGKGLAEMLITDLSQIQRLKLVERIRVQSLFDEMELGQTGLVDESTTAKFGKLLSAGKVVRGDITMTQKDKVRMDAVTMNSVQNQVSKPVSVTDAFNNLFRVEKDLAFKVLNLMGVDPTPQERQRILRVPTKNLQAFIAYCNGLDLEDRGEYKKASVQYKKALALDPNYSTAKAKLRASEILARAGEGGMIRETTPTPGSDRLGRPLFDQQTLINDRLRNVQTNIGSNFILGKDVRKSTQETSEAVGIDDWDFIDEFPAPPAPPTVQP